MPDARPTSSEAPRDPGQPLDIPPGVPPTPPARPPEGPTLHGEPGPLERPASARRVLVVMGVVVGIAAIAFAFLVVSAQKDQSAPSHLPTTGGGGLAARPAGADFHPSGGEPPPDVLAALPVPVGSVAGPVVNEDRGNGTYDRNVDYQVPAPYDQVVAFYGATLSPRGWGVQAVVGVNGAQGERFLARHSGSDGFYWEAGITVYQPVTTPSSSTRFNLRLYQVDES